MLSAKFLWIDALWLVLLAVSYVALARELTLVDRRTLLYGALIPDGLDVGRPAPNIARITQADIFVFLFADCGGCHELVDHLNDVQDRARLAVVVRDEREPAMAQSMAGRVRSDIEIFTGEVAQTLIESFSVHSAPIAFRVDRGLIVAKGYLRDATDIQGLILAAPTALGRPENVASVR